MTRHCLQTHRHPLFVAITVRECERLTLQRYAGRQAGSVAGLGYVCSFYVINKLIRGVKPVAVQPVVRPERHAEELPVGLDLKVLQLATVPRVLSISGHEVGELNVVTSRHRLTTVTCIRYNIYC